MKKLDKKQLIVLAKELGYFKNSKMSVIYARSNGNFYYSKPPDFVDNHETFTIKRDDLSSKKAKNNDDKTK